jgi:TonB family protein
MDYPRLGGMAQITGTVVLRLRIDSAGAIASVNALSGHPVLAKAAEQNIRLWRFSPARSAGQRVDAEFDFIYVFKLEGVTECPRPASSLIYEYPDKVTITSEAPHMQP